LIYRYKSVLQANDPSEADRPALVLDVKSVRCRCTRVHNVHRGC